MEDSILELNCDGKTKDVLLKLHKSNDWENLFEENYKYITEDFINDELYSRVSYILSEYAVRKLKEIKKTNYEVYVLYNLLCQEVIRGSPLDKEISKQDMINIIDVMPNISWKIFKKYDVHNEMLDVLLKKSNWFYKSIIKGMIWDGDIDMNLVTNKQRYSLYKIYKINIYPFDARAYNVHENEIILSKMEKIQKMITLLLKTKPCSILNIIRKSPVYDYNIVRVIRRFL